MNEIEKIADRLLRWKIDWVPLPLDGAAEAKVRELDAILRDMRGIKLKNPPTPASLRTWLPPAPDRG